MGGTSYSSAAICNACGERLPGARQKPCPTFPRISWPGGGRPPRIGIGRNVSRVITMWQIHLPQSALARSRCVSAAILRHAVKRSNGRLPADPYLSTQTSRFNWLPCSDAPQIYRQMTGHPLRQAETRLCMGPAITWRNKDESQAKLVGRFVAKVTKISAVKGHPAPVSSPVHLLLRSTWSAECPWDRPRLISVLSRL